MCVTFIYEEIYLVPSLTVWLSSVSGISNLVVPFNWLAFFNVLNPDGASTPGRRYFVTFESKANELSELIYFLRLFQPALALRGISSSAKQDRIYGNLLGSVSSPVGTPPVTRSIGSSVYSVPHNYVEAR